MSGALDRDVIQPFLAGPAAIRGRGVRLGPALDEVLAAHDHPPVVAALMAEALVLAVGLASTMTFDGTLTLQARGEGIVRTLVADITTEGAVRAFAGYDREAAAAVDLEEGRASVPALLGAGHLAFTVDQGESARPFQGIVDLEGATLAECLQQYFRRSEQVDTVLKVGVMPPADGHGWQAGLLSLQRLPDEAPLEPEAGEEAWRTAVILLASAEAAEIAAAAPELLAQRLFAAEGLQLYEPRGVFARCHCSRGRVETTLRGFGQAELADMVEPDGLIHVTCAFCATTYSFAPADLEAPS